MSRQTPGVDRSSFDTAPAVNLVISTWLPAEFAEEFAEWCDTHHRGLLTVPGVRRARRFEVRSGSSADAPDILTTYELDDPSIIGSPTWKERGTAHGPLPSAITDRLRTDVRTMMMAAAFPSSWWPPVPAELLDVFTVIGTTRTDALVDAVGRLVPDDDRIVTLRILRDQSETALVLIDHRVDEGRDTIDLLTDASGAHRSRWTVVFDESADEVDPTEA